MTTETNTAPAVKVEPRFFATDGSMWTSRANADLRNKTIIRRDRIVKVERFDTDMVSRDDNGKTYVAMEDMPEFLAQNGELLLELLTVKSNRGRKPKA